MKESYLEQARYIINKDVINEVITLQEASEILGLNDSTLRKYVLTGKFKDGEYRKAKATVLFNKDVILKMKCKK